MRSLMNNLMILAMLAAPALLAAPSVASVSPNMTVENGVAPLPYCDIVSNASPSDFSNFTVGNANAKVLFGTVQVPNADITKISDTRLRVRIPAQSKRAVDIVVTDNANASSANTAADNFTYTKDNTNLQVVVQMTINAKASIRWGSLTANDDSGAVRNLTILPYLWIIADPVSGTDLDLGASYKNNDAANNNKITIENTSRTSTAVNLNATATNSSNWSLFSGAGAPGANQYKLEALLVATANSLRTVTATPATVALTDVAPLASPAEAELELTLTTPSTITTGIGAAQQFILVVTATP
jgi:hypothetical protein